MASYKKRLSYSDNKLSADVALVSTELRVIWQYQVPKSYKIGVGHNDEGIFYLNALDTTAAELADETKLQIRVRDAHNRRIITVWEGSYKHANADPTDRMKKNLLPLARNERGQIIIAKEGSYIEILAQPPAAKTFDVDAANVVNLDVTVFI